MIDHVWSVLCSRSVTDKDTNLISLIDVVDEITVEIGQLLQQTQDGAVLIDLADLPASELPVLPVSFELISLWVRRVSKEAESGTARIMWKAPGEDPKLLGKVYDVDLSGEFKRLRTRVRISGVPARTSGRYSFSVEFRLNEQEQWQEVASLPLDVIMKFEAAEGESVG